MPFLGGSDGMQRLCAVGLDRVYSVACRYSGDEFLVEMWTGVAPPFR